MQPDQDAEVVRFVDLLTALPGFVGLHYNPAFLVRAVNHAHAIGRERALLALMLYCTRAVDDAHLNPDNAILLARVLFVQKAPSHAKYQLRLGQPDIGDNLDPANFPLFPLHLEQDIPFLLVSGYTLAGEAEPPMHFVEWCTHECDLRASPLRPADDPLQAVTELLATADWKSLQPSARNNGILRLESLRCVSHLRPISEKDLRDLLSGDSQKWETIRSEVKGLRTAWNADLGRYESGSQNPM